MNHPPRGNALKAFQQPHQPIGNGRADPGLGNLKHQEHHAGKYQQAGHRMGQHRIPPILGVFFAGAHLARFHPADDLPDKLKAFPIRLLHLALVRQIHARLFIGRLLHLPAQSHGGAHHRLQPHSSGGNRFDHRAAQFPGQGRRVDHRPLFFVDVAFIQRHYHGDPQLQQLRGKKQAAAQVRGVHDIDDHIGGFLLDIAAGDALLRCEGRHGIGPGQIDRDQGLLSGIGLLHGHAGPVAHPLAAAGQGVIHGRFSAVGIACKCYSHK